MNRTSIAALSALAPVAMLLLAGCRVETDKHGDGDNVKISTPFGGMQVKTNDAATVEDIGLAAYPGAQLLQHDNDDGSADVNMSFGGFQLRVKAASFRTGDTPGKVEAFYRNDMKRFGDVIACRDNHAVGTPSKTFEGLTCDDQKNGHVKVQADQSKHQLELKAGSRQHQHIAEIDPDGGGTKIGLVALDLPKTDTDDDK
jgi:hypothetical protein